MSSRGRPVDAGKQIEQKENLLDAAKALLGEKGYRAITIREIGERAGVNSAMIRYYFENKEGLFIALFDRMATMHFQHIVKQSEQEDPLFSVIKGLLQLLNQNAGVARLIHDEIFQSDSVLRDAFIERFPKRMAEFLPKLIQSQLKIDDPQKAKFLAFNLISMLVMPFVGAPVRKLAWEISDQEIATNEWAAHIYQLFTQGVNSFSTMTGQGNTPTAKIGDKS